MNAVTGEPDPGAELGRLLEEDPADLYENAPMGYLSALPDGRIVKVNRTFCAWTGRSPDDLLGVRFQDLLTMGGRVFHETHLVPLLRMQGAVREIALDVVRLDGSVLPCLINAVEVRDDDGAPLLMRATLFEATARRRYERELMAAQRAAEESEARSRTVQRVVSDMAAATTVADVAEVIVVRGREAMGAHGAALVLVEEDPSGAQPRLRTEHATGLSSALLHELRAAEESEARSRTVQRVVSDMAAATSVADVAEVIAVRGRAAMGARGAALVLVEENPSGALPLLRTEHATGLSSALLHELRVAAIGQLALELAQGVRTVTLDDRLRTERPAIAAGMAADGLSSLVLVPVTSDNRRLGVLVLGLGPDQDGLISLDVAETARVPGPADIQLLWTLGRQAGQALERARLHEETARQAERSAFLLEAARLLASAADVAETVERLAALAVERLADLCAIDLTSEHGMSRPVARHRDPALQGIAEELRQRPLPARGSAHPSVEALRQRRSVWVPALDDDLLDQITADDRHREITRQLELVSIIAVPFVVEGRALGVITLAADAHRGRFTAADVEVAEQLGLQVSLVLAKAQRYELDVRTSHTLQANLLPPNPPEVSGLQMAVRYLAATQGVEVGGDFYDVVRLPDEQVALAVGDVVGHDITAAATMGQLNSVYRALLVDRPAPSAMIDRLQASWPLLGMQRMATALFATLDPATGRLRIASAGHLAPLLLTAGYAEFLPVAPSRMLGAPPAPAPALEWAGVLPAGATLVLFTDGLVESRAADIDQGLAHLLAAAEAADTSDPDELCDRLLADLTGAHRADDIALLVLTRTA